MAKSPQSVLPCCICVLSTQKIMWSEADLIIEVACMLTQGAAHQYWLSYTFTSDWSIPIIVILWFLPACRIWTNGGSTTWNVRFCPKKVGWRPQVSGNCLFSISFVALICLLVSIHWELMSLISSLDSLIAFTFSCLDAFISVGFYDHFCKAA